MGQVKNKKVATPTPPKDDFKRPVMLNALPKNLPPANKKTTGSGASAGSGEMPSVKNVAKPTPTKKPVDNRTASQKKRMAGMIGSITKDKTVKKSAPKRVTVPAAVKKQMTSTKRPTRSSTFRRGR